MTPNFRALGAKIIELWDADCDIDVEINELRELLATPPPEPFVVRHYASDDYPSIKGNGFDGLQVGEDREEAEEFIAWVNKHCVLATVPP